MQRFARRATLPRLATCLSLVLPLAACGGGGGTPIEKTVVGSPPSETPVVAPPNETPVAGGTPPGAPGVSGEGPVVPVIRPDMVVVVADDMRWDLTSDMGHPFLQTPNLDALASSGVVMESATVPHAICSPSRAAILTGRDPHTASAPTIVWENNSFLDTQRTVAEELRDAGYLTAYIGKWHLGRGRAPRRGFDHWESFDWLGDFFDTTLWINGEETRFEGYADDIIAERARVFLDANRDSDKPIFLMVGLKAPHLRFEYPDRHADAFADDVIPTPDTYDEDFAESGKLQRMKDWLGMEEFVCALKCFGTWDNYIKSHYRAVLSIDDSIGTIREATEARGKGDDTLFVYTSDNGYSLGDHGLSEKHYLYEEPIRVPLLIDFPGSDDSGIRRDELTTLMDIAPTLLDYAGAEIPETMTGRSMRPLVSRTELADGDWREEVFLMYAREYIAIRTGTHKLIKALEVPGHYELYDLVRDPKETRNVHDDPAHAEVRAEMHRRLDALVTENGWSERTTYPVRRVMISDPFPTAEADELASAVSRGGMADGTPFSPDGRPLGWRTLDVGGGTFADRFMLHPDPAATEGLSVLVALPIEKLVDWDPYTEVRLRRRPEATLYVDGDRVVGTRDRWTVADRQVTPHLNPPLHEPETMLVLRFDDGGAMDVKIDYEAPADTMRLPLEERHLGTAPGRFFDEDGWQPHADVTIARRDGALLVTPAGERPQLRTENVHVDGRATLRIRYRAAEASEATLLWRPEHGSYGPDASTAFTFEGGGGVHEIALGLDAAEDIDALRIDISDDVGELLVEEMVLVSRDGQTLQEWRFD